MLTKTWKHLSNVLMRLKHFPLPISSSLKPFVLLISTLSSENRLREKFPAAYICIFARLAISREVKRATQQFKHFSGAEQRYLLSPALLRTVMEEQTRIPFLMNSENQGLLSPPLIHSSENIPPLYSFPFRATFPQFKLLLNSSFSRAPDYKLFLVSIRPCARCNSLHERLLILLLLPSYAASTFYSLLHLHTLPYPAACLRAAAHTSAKRYLIISILSAKAFGETVY